MEYLKIEIEFIPRTPKSEPFTSGWKVTHGDKYADTLMYEEMIGLVTAITMPEKRPTLQWLKTKEQHKAWLDRLKNNSKKIEIKTNK